MDKQTANAITDRVKEILAKEFPDYKVAFKGGRYTDVTLDMKLEFHKVGTERPEFTRARDYVKILNVKMENATDRIVGMTARRTKYRWIIENKSSGKKMKATQDYIVEKFK